MGHQQIEWVREAKEPARTFRKMVIGWQSIMTALNATVLAFNDEHFSFGESDPHRGMKVIAIKKLVVGALFEIKDRLDEWYKQLNDMNVVSDDSQTTKKELRPILKQVEKLEEARNLAFHFGDATDPTDQLLKLYEDIDAFSLSQLNLILRSLVRLGERLKEDALIADEKLKEQT